MIGRFLLLAVVTLLVFSSLAGASDDTRYTMTTIRGRLTDPATGEPMAGATVRFQPVDEGLERVVALTDEEGAFVARGLAFANYVVEIETAEGEKILGVNELPIVEGQPVVVDMKISDRIVSTTSLENQPARFAAIVDKKGIDWKRFWVEFGVFFGAAVTGGAAAL